MNLCGHSLAYQPVGRPIPDCPFDPVTGIPCDELILGAPFPDLQVTPPLPCPQIPGVPDDEAFCLQWGTRNFGQFVRDQNCIAPSGQMNNCWEGTGVAGIDVDVVPAWNRTTGHPAVGVCVLDSGIEYCNPDFDQSRFYPNDFSLTGIGTGSIEYVCCDFSGNFDPPCNFGPARDNLGHGTFVASLIGATSNNGIGIAGIDQRCRILSVRFGGSLGAGPLHQFLPQVKIARAIIALEEIWVEVQYKDIRIINMSFAYPKDQSAAAEQISAFESVGAAPSH